MIRVYRVRRCALSTCYFESNMANGGYLGARFLSDGMTSVFKDVVRALRMGQVAAIQEEDQ